MDMGVGSVHIGGGEPFLSPDALMDTLRAAKAVGMGIEYVETNASWFSRTEKAERLLKEIRRAGVTCLLVSISPFHNEYIPFKKTRTLMDQCRREGISVFPWVNGFVEDLTALGEDKTHPFTEFETVFGKDYLSKIPAKYWVHPGGRALYTFAPIAKLRRPEKLPGFSAPCRELYDTSHFHVDLYSRYIPGLCSGFGVKTEDLTSSLQKEKYPILTMLSSGGVSAFLEFAQNTYGFVPDSGYTSKCQLCSEIRMYLVLHTSEDFSELHPKEFYRELESWKSAVPTVDR